MVLYIKALSQLCGRLLRKTALAEAEIEYHDHKSDTIWVPFKIIKGSKALENVKIVIWTTTPWTIPSNKAIAFNPKISYGIYEVIETEEESWTAPGQQYIFADVLAEETLTKSRVVKFERVSDVHTSDLMKQFAATHSMLYKMPMDFGIMMFQLLKVIMLMKRLEQVLYTQRLLMVRMIMIVL